MKSVAIIGAGIAGLTAASYFKRKAIPATFNAAGRCAAAGADQTEAENTCPTPHA
jgi:predicted NAD/FAD-binding protein